MGLGIAMSLPKAGPLGMPLGGDQSFGESLSICLGWNGVRKLLISACQSPQWHGRGAAWGVSPHPRSQHGVLSQLILDALPLKGQQNLVVVGGKDTLYVKPCIGSSGTGNSTEGQAPCYQPPLASLMENGL